MILFVFQFILEVWTICPPFKQHYLKLRISFISRKHTLSCLCLIACSFCFVFLRLMCPMLSVSLDCPFIIAHSILSNVYVL